jgi:hypothetical protein
VLIVSNGRLWLAYRGPQRQIYLGPRNRDGTFTCSVLPTVSTVVPITDAPPALVTFANELIIAWGDPVTGFIYVQRVGENCIPLGEPVNVNVSIPFNLGAFPALGAFNSVLYVAWLDLNLHDDNFWIYWSKSTDCLSWPVPTFQKVKGTGVALGDVCRSPRAPCFCCENGKVMLCWIQVQTPDPIYKCVLSADPSERIAVSTTATQPAWGVCQGLGIASSGDRYVLFVTTFNGAFAIYLIPSEGDVIAFTFTASGDSSSQYAVAGQFEGATSKICMVWTGAKLDPAQPGACFLEESEFDLP